MGGERAERELESRVSAAPSLNSLLDSITAALDLEGMVAEGVVNPKWNIRTAEVIRTIRMERASVQREVLYKIREDAKDERLRRQMATGGGWRGESE